MVVEYKTIGGPAWVLLFDESTAGAGGAVLPEFNPQFSRPKQEENTYQGAALYRQPIGNYACECTLAFTMTFADRAACLGAARTVCAALLTAGKMHFRVTQDGEVQYYPNALVHRASLKPSGASADFTAAFSSDLVTSTAPTT